jgi:hypothetical protein
LTQLEEKRRVLILDAVLKIVCGGVDESPALWEEVLKKTTAEYDLSNYFNKTNPERFEYIFTPEGAESFSDFAHTLLLSLRQGPLPIEVGERVHQTIEFLFHEIDWAAWGSRDDFESLSADYDGTDTMKKNLKKLCLLHAANLALRGDREGLHTLLTMKLDGFSITLVGHLSYLNTSFLARRILDPESVGLLKTISQEVGK